MKLMATIFDEIYPVLQFTVIDTCVIARKHFNIPYTCRDNLILT